MGLLNLENAQDPMIANAVLFAIAIFLAYGF
jgi:hypothetical protein